MSGAARVSRIAILSIAVESPTADIKVLSSLAEKVIKKRLETVSGVGQVTLVGLARREIQVLLDRDAPGQEDLIDDTPPEEPAEEPAEAAGAPG